MQSFIAVISRVWQVLSSVTKNSSSVIALRRVFLAYTMSGVADLVFYAVYVNFP